MFLIIFFFPFLFFFPYFLVKDDKREMELFCKEGWKESLCKCDNCKALFYQDQLDFLIDGEKMIDLPQPNFSFEEEEENGQNVWLSLSLTSPLQNLIF